MKLPRCIVQQVRLALVASSTVAVACSSGEPFARGAVSDPIVHSMTGVRLSNIVYVGRRSQVRLSNESDSIATLENDTLRCWRAADIYIERISPGSLTDTLRILCRPIASIRFDGTPDLLLHEGARRMVINAEDPQGTPIKELQGTVLVEDTSVVRIAGDTIFPKRVGATWVRVDVGDCNHFSAIYVKDTVGSPLLVAPLHEYARTFSLARDEYLALPLPKGWIGITARPSLFNSAGDFLLGIHGANCAKLTAAPNDWSCMVDSTATALLRAGNTPTTGTVLIRTLGRDSLSLDSPGKRLKDGARSDSLCRSIVR